MRKVIRLARMDLRTENSKDIALFFTLFNEMLQKVTGKPDYKFNPCYFLCGEGGAKHKAIKIVYREDFCKERLVGCQWHFRSNADKKSKKLPDDMHEINNNYKPIQPLDGPSRRNGQEAAHTTAFDQMLGCQMPSHCCPF